MIIKEDDILCLDDIVFFNLDYKRTFADSKIYGINDERYLLDKIKNYKEEDLYRISFMYKVK